MSSFASGASSTATETELRQRERRALAKRRLRRGIDGVHETEGVAIQPRCEVLRAEIDLDEITHLRSAMCRELRRVCRGVLEAHPVYAVEVALQLHPEHASLRG